MLIVTTEKVEGKKISKVLGLVRGSTIRAKHVGKDIGASFKNLVGGELTGYNEMLTEARQIAIGEWLKMQKLKVQTQ
ncbi:heavy-metal-binding family protein [Clostridioides difficile DA00165]|nr:heavy-metal-binding family protein [Clostridioides difficile DA00165]